MHKWDGEQSFPYVITIFSAPNYCGYYDNKAAVLVMEEGNLSLKQYEESEVPYKLPDNMDIFTWSVPFLVEKVLAIMAQILKKTGDEDEAPEANPKAETIETKKGIFKAKIQSVSKMHKMFHTLTLEREDILKIKNMSADGKLPRGLLLEGKLAIKNHLKQFENALMLDAKNEMRPKQP